MVKVALGSLVAGQEVSMAVGTAPDRAAQRSPPGPCTAAPWPDGRMSSRYVPLLSLTLNRSRSATQLLSRHCVLARRDEVEASR